MKQRRRLVFCTYPCFYSSLVLQSLLTSPDVEIVAVISSTRNLRINENSLVSSAKRIRQSGLRYAAYLWLITSGHAFFSRYSRASSIQTLAKQHNIPHYTTNNINNSEMKGLISELSPEVLLCAHFNQRIAPEVYSLAKSALNIHPSLLPDLKGVDPSFYALLDNYKESGVSLHELAETFDTGVVVSNQMEQIEPAASLFSLNCKLFLAGGGLALSYLSNNKNNRAIQTITTERYVSWPSAVEVAIFRKRKRLLSMQDIKWIFSTPSAKQTNR